MKTIPRTVLLLGSLFIPLVSGAAAASADPAPSATDQVVITATRDRLVKLDKEIELAEQRFYARYNELNTKRDYAVKCYNEAETGTRFKKTTCQAVFASKAEQENSRRLIAALSSSATPATTTSAAYSMHAGAMVGVSGMGAGTGSGEQQETLPSAASEVAGPTATVAVEGSQSDFQGNMIELTSKSSDLQKLLNKYSDLLKERDATRRKLKGLSPQDAQGESTPTAPASH